MTEHYDVIIIGTGAGGGTLAHTLAPIRASGSCSSSAATSCRARWRTGTPSRCSSTAGTSRQDTWYDADGKPFQPQVHYFVGGATKLYGAALYRLRPQDFGELQARRRHLAGVAAHLRRLRAVVHEGRVALPGARQPRRGPDRGPLEQAVPVAGGVARAADPAALRRPRSGRATTRSTRRAASCSTRPTGRRAPASAAPGATATRAWCTPSPTPRRSPCGRSSTTPNVTLLVDAEVHEARDRRDRAHGHRRRRVARRRHERPTRPTSSWCRPAPSNSAKLLLAVGQRPAPERAGQRLGPGRPQLHVPQQQGRRRAVEGAQRHRLPEDARAERLLLRRRRLRVAGRQHPDGRQVQRRGDEGRGAEAHEARPALVSLADVAQPRRRLLAHHRGPPDAGEPGHASTATATSTSPTSRPTTRRPTASTTS